MTDPFAFHDPFVFVRTTPEYQRQACQNEDHMRKLRGRVFDKDPVKRRQRAAAGVKEKQDEKE